MAIVYDTLSYSDPAWITSLSVSKVTGAVSGSGAATRVAFWSSASALASSANFTFDNTTATLRVGADATTYTGSNVVVLANNVQNTLAVVGASVGVNINLYLNGAVDRKVAIHGQLDGTDGGALALYTKISGSASIFNVLQLNQDGTSRFGLGRDATAFTQLNAVLIASANTEALGVAGSTVFSDINFYLSGTAARKVTFQAGNYGTQGGYLDIFSKPDSAADVNRVARFFPSTGVGIGDIGDPGVGGLRVGGTLATGTALDTTVYTSSGPAMIATGAGEALGVAGGTVLVNINLFLKGQAMRRATVQGVAWGTQGGGLTIFAKPDSTADVTPIASFYPFGVQFTGVLYERNRTTPIGEWTNVVYSASNFFAPTGTWVVDAGDSVTFAYALVGKTAYVAFQLDTTTITGTPSEIYIVMPGGLQAKRGTFAFFQATDNGVTAVGTARVAAFDTVIRLQSTAGGGGWSTSTNNTFVRGIFIFEVV